ncbi:MAG: hypothetical protein M0R50_09140 [Candidatus Cloacimonetes bacterium]|jgi:hypothetical protein|nr:hypothetical protein [Candidatus Cloacimonadota bacterium]
MISARDQSISDYKWWFSEFAEFEDFVGIGEDRALTLAIELDNVGYPQVCIERMLVANGLSVDNLIKYCDRLRNEDKRNQKG